MKHPHTLHPPLLPVALVLLTLVSCSGDGGNGDARGRLAANRALWESQHVTAYRMRQQISCFCPQEVTKPFIADVRPGNPTYVRGADDGKPMPATWSLTVEEAFDKVEQALDAHYGVLDVDYDRAMGYPHSVHMDPGGGAVDGGFDVTIDQLQPLGALPPCSSPPPEACSCGGDRLDGLSYRYTAWDSAGTPIAEGCMTLDFTQDPDGVSYSVSGHRCIHLVCADGHTDDPHEGTLDVAGGIDPAGQMFLNLNVGWADNNIFLNAPHSEANAPWFGGRWDRSTIVGPVEGGRFLLEAATSEVHHPNAPDQRED